LLESDLALGWNLSASADAKTPTQLNAGLSTSLGAAGKGIATQCAWEASAARWKFFAPSLAALGGTVLSDYINSKTYAAFETAIGLQAGFWLNVSAVAATGGGSTTLPPTFALTDTGITASQCYAAGSDVLVSCTSATAIALNASQDGMIGRDVSTPDAADGKLGFSYSSVPNPASYTNYDNTAAAQFWNDSASVNPTQTDIDAATNTAPDAYWSATSWSFDPSVFWIVDFRFGYVQPTGSVNWNNRYDSGHVRLVR
jgi:hypothetical protein